MRMMGCVMYEVMILGGSRFWSFAVQGLGVFFSVLVWDSTGQEGAVFLQVYGLIFGESYRR